MSEPSPIGKFGWTDLTVNNAAEIRDFYQQVTGWTTSPVNMDGYEDFCMVSADGTTVAGICHARGENADLPPMWLVYIYVEDLQQSIENCESLGGKKLHGPRKIEGGQMAVIQDPAGAVVALFQAEKG